MKMSLCCRYSVCTQTSTLRRVDSSCPSFEYDLHAESCHEGSMEVGARAVSQHLTALLLLFRILKYYYYYYLHHRSRFIDFLSGIKQIFACSFVNIDLGAMIYRVPASYIIFPFLF